MFGFARASALYMLSNILPKISAVFLVPIYVRVLSAAEYGTIALLVTLVGLLTMVYRLGMDGSLMRLHFDSSADDRGGIYGTATLFTLGVAGVSTVVLAAAGPFLFGLFPGDIPFFPLGLLALLIALVSSIGFVPSVFFRATRQASKFAAFNIGGFVLTSAMVVLLLVVWRFGTAGVLFGQLIGGAILLVIALWVVLRLGRLHLDRKLLGEMLSLGLPLLPHAVSGWALRLMDRWLIGLFIGLPAAQALAAIGTYSLGYQIGSVVTILMASFNAAWAPYFYGIAERQAAPRLYRHMTTVVLAGVFVVAVGLSATSREIVQVVARPGYEAAADVISVVALGAVFYAFYTMFVTIVFVAKRTRRLALLTTASVFVNLVLNALLIPTLGVVGAAWATVGSYAFFAAVTYLYARRMYPMSVDGVRLFLTALLGIAVAMGARALQPTDLIVSIALHFLISVGYAGVVLLVLVQPMRQLLRLRGEIRQIGAADRLGTAV